ncbi:Hypothetical predicted protein [Xyrichtys novacula]|uniref:Uncharacterized protein n=1 Tax=Xyrichtys novacula TaxID=13765 RepID=A0AAV1GWY3_XYRNO|nr:Hypothetical predicted protein [Xyrichtys novacula]
MLSNCLILQPTVSSTSDLIGASPARRVHLAGSPSNTVSSAPRPQTIETPSVGLAAEHFVSHEPSAAPYFPLSSDISWVIQHSSTMQQLGSVLHSSRPRIKTRSAATSLPAYLPGAAQEPGQ